MIQGASEGQYGGRGRMGRKGKERERDGRVSDDAQSDDSQG